MGPQGRNGAIAGSQSAAGYVRSTVRRCDCGAWEEFTDYVVEEEVVDAYVNGVKECTLVCSPSNLYELTIGRLYMEGRIEKGCTVTEYVYDKGRKAVFVRVDVPDGAYAVSLPCRERALPFSLSSSEVLRLMNEMEANSRVFHKTGGVHSAALACKGSIVARYDDLGRFNAIDKLAGWCFRNGIDLSDKVLLFSGRVPHEVVAKVKRLGCPIIVSPGAPTSLSIDMAERAGIAIVGFAKGHRLNVYSCCERITDTVAMAAG